MKSTHEPIERIDQPVEPDDQAVGNGDPLASDSQSAGNVNKQSDPAHSTGTFFIRCGWGLIHCYLVLEETFSDDVPLAHWGGCSFVQADEG